MTPATPAWSRFATALALSALCLPAAHAEANPYYAGISVGGGHLSNITLAPSDSGKVRADLYTSLGLVAGIDQPFGRQRFRASGTVTANKFQDETSYDNTAYNLAAGLDWSAAERLSGNLNLGLQQRLEYATGTVGQTDERNVARTGLFSARVQYGLADLMALEASLAHREARYTAAAYANSRLTQDAVSAGIRRRLGGQLDLGAALRLTHGRYPIYGFDRRDLDLSAIWVATGASTIDARLSIGRQDNAGNVADNSGISGRLQWTYVPTGKLRFVTTLRRDDGTDSGLDVNPFAPGSNDLVPTEFTRLTNGLGVVATYEATAKIRVTASASVARRSLRQVTAGTGGAPTSGLDGRDTTTGLSLGVTWAPTRHWQVACDAGRQSRSTDGSALTYSYGNTVASCSVQYVIQ